MNHIHIKGKKIKTVILSLAVFLMFFSCLYAILSKLQNKKKNMIKEVPSTIFDDKVKAELISFDLKQGFATVRLTNNSDSELEYGESISVFEIDGNMLKELKLKDRSGFEDSMYVLKSGESAVKEFWIGAFEYDHMESGKYILRINYLNLTEDDEKIIYEFYSETERKNIFYIDLEF